MVERFWTTNGYQMGCKRECICESSCMEFVVVFVALVFDRYLIRHICFYHVSKKECKQ